MPWILFSVEQILYWELHLLKWKKKIHRKYMKGDCECQVVFLICQSQSGYSYCNDEESQISIIIFYDYNFFIIIYLQCYVILYRTGKGPVIHIKNILFLILSASKSITSYGISSLCYTAWSHCANTKMKQLESLITDRRAMKISNHLPSILL